MAERKVKFLSKQFMDETRRVEIKNNVAKKIFSNNRGNKFANAILDTGFDTSILEKNFKVLSKST